MPGWLTDLALGVTSAFQVEKRKPYGVVLFIGSSPAKRFPG